MYCMVWLGYRDAKAYVNQCCIVCVCGVMFGAQYLGIISMSSLHSHDLITVCMAIMEIASAVYFGQVHDG